MAFSKALLSSPVLGARVAAPRPAACPARQAPAQRLERLRVRAEDPNAPDPSAIKSDVLDYARSLPGISQPFPNIFDPLNFLGNASSPADVKRWRESEITHGRVSMLAALGIIVQEQTIDNKSLPFPHVEGPAITHFQQVESQGAIFWEPLVFAIGLAEAYRVGLGWATPTSENFNKLKPEYEPDPAAQKDIQTKELNNGRLAMIAVAAFVAQELVEQKAIFENVLVKLGRDIQSSPNL